MIALANVGFRAIAPDYRGYGLSESPREPEKTLHGYSQRPCRNPRFTRNHQGLSPCLLFSTQRGLRGCNNRSATRTQRLTQSADEEFSITEPKVKVPALLFMGAKDYVFKFTGI
ncbi:hypothetical protein GH714_017564 [Hevea brasiliensis]|uniref:Uncharacterized protein n=1 Tax=Hevea brasiliensis TaxID=3981 RepID=A0A6A6LSA5_HEVBR|nr:hypothetical protein GH714_017564 [Hevea brasiliensis]